MKTIILVVTMFVGLNSFAGEVVKPVGAAKGTMLSGKIERMDASENTAMIKMKGQSRMLMIPQMTNFSAEKLNKLTESKDSGKEVKLQVDSSNQVLEIQ